MKCCENCSYYESEWQYCFKAGCHAPETGYCGGYKEKVEPEGWDNVRVRRCDCCGKDIEPCTGKLFTMKKYYVRADFEDVPGKYWHYDLCDRCAKLIEDTIKVGVKPEWLGE